MRLDRGELTAPGVQAQMDLSTYEIEFTQEGKRRVQLFSYILSYSRRQYIHFTDRQDFETTIRQHIAAFEHLGGAATTCLYDNMKVVVIQIPIIQRDYAQGRESESDVRELFLSELKTALSRPDGNGINPLNLDFIYGSVEGENNDSRFSPLDGQQRLTTLFLLHWYLAWKDGRFDAFTAMFRKGDTSRFTYRVRPSSNQFFDMMVNFKPEIGPDQLASHESVSALVNNQSWYFRNWRLDPTIQSALVMLDAIHEHFGDSIGLFDRLTNEEKPAITFQLLDLDKFDLTDAVTEGLRRRSIDVLTSQEDRADRFDDERLLQRATDLGRFTGEYSSCDAQFDACFHFLRAHVSLGWFWNGHRYDDQGESGGRGDRPALTRLFADIAAGNVERGHCVPTGPPRSQPPSRHHDLAGTS